MAQIRGTAQYNLGNPQFGGGQYGGGGGMQMGPGMGGTGMGINQGMGGGRGEDPSPLEAIRDRKSVV